MRLAPSCVSIVWGEEDDGGGATLLNTADTAPTRQVGVGGSEEIVLVTLRPLRQLGREDDAAMRGNVAVIDDGSACTSKMEEMSAAAASDGYADVNI